MQLITWNTQRCCGLDGSVDPGRIVQTLHALGDSDVVCLQEIAINFTDLQGAPQDQVAQLQALLPGWQLFFGAAVDMWGSRGRQQFGNLIATRLPVLQVQHYPLPYPGDVGVRSMPRMATVVTVQDPRLGPVQVITTHLEFYSKRQRMTQARYLRRLLFEGLSQYYAPALAGEEGSPYQKKPYAYHAVLCGDFNFDAQEPEYSVMASAAAVIECLEAGWPEQVVGTRWNDAWRLLSPDQNQPATFKLNDRRFGPEPVACDFVWVSDGLRSHVQSFEVDGLTQASDHQPVRVVIGH